MNYIVEIITAIIVYAIALFFPQLLYVQIAASIIGLLCLLAYGYSTTSVLSHSTAKTANEKVSVLITQRLVGASVVLVMMQLVPYNDHAVFGSWTTEEFNITYGIVILSYIFLLSTISASVKRKRISN